MRLLLKIAVGAAAVLLMNSGCIHRVPVETPLNPSWTSPQIVRFTAQPQIVQRGEKALLTWNVRNVSGVLLEEYREPSLNTSEPLSRTLGKFPANGNTSVSPKSTAVYVLTCGGPGETVACVSASVSIVVK